MGDTLTIQRWTEAQRIASNLGLSITFYSENFQVYRGEKHLVMFDSVVALHAYFLGLMRGFEEAQNRPKPASDVRS